MAASVMAVVAKKAAAVLLSDKRTWTVILSIIAGVIMLCLLPAMVLMAMFGSANETNMRGLAGGIDTQQIIENMTPEQLESLRYFETVMISVADEITVQGIDTDPVKAQIILLCALTDHVDSENFIQDYVSCFAETEDDGQIFDNIVVVFGVEISAGDREKILSLYADAVEFQTTSST